MGLTPSQPNIEFWNTELYGGPKQYDDFPVDHKHAFAMCALLFNQQSRGTVTLKSADPLENPVVDHAYLQDPLDMLVMSEACRFANEIVTKGSGTKGVIKGSWPEGLMHHGFKTREEWEPHVRKHATTCKLLFSLSLSRMRCLGRYGVNVNGVGYHPSGTCAMGKADNPNAVLDSRLRVRGVRNLRVADVSSIPKVNNGHTQMVAYGIGEGAAEMIKEDAGNQFLKLTADVKSMKV
jgi:choline dehydrogenase-like flavoprotein